MGSRAPDDTAWRRSRRYRRSRPRPRCRRTRCPPRLAAESNAPSAVGRPVTRRALRSCALATSVASTATKWALDLHQAALGLAISILIPASAPTAERLEVAGRTAPRDRIRFGHRSRRQGRRPEAHFFKEEVTRPEHGDAGTWSWWHHRGSTRRAGRHRAATPRGYPLISEQALSGPHVRALRLQVSVRDRADLLSGSMGRAQAWHGEQVQASTTRLGPRRRRSAARPWPVRAPRRARHGGRNSPPPRPARRWPQPGANSAAGDYPARLRNEAAACAAAAAEVLGSVSARAFQAAWARTAGDERGAAHRPPESRLRVEWWHRSRAAPAERDLPERVAGGTGRAEAAWADCARRRQSRRAAGGLYRWLSAQMAPGRGRERRVLEIEEERERCPDARRVHGTRQTSDRAPAGSTSSTVPCFAAGPASLLGTSSSLSIRNAANRPSRGGFHEGDVELGRKPTARLTEFRSWSGRGPNTVMVALTGSWQPARTFQGAAAGCPCTPSMPGSRVARMSGSRSSPGSSLATVTVHRRFRLSAPRIQGVMSMGRSAARVNGACTQFAGRGKLQRLRRLVREFPSAAPQRPAHPRKARPPPGRVWS